MKKNDFKEILIIILIVFIFSFFYSALWIKVINKAILIFNREVILYLFPIISLLISFILWYIYGKNKKGVKLVEYYPPRELNSLEVGYLSKGKVSYKDTTTLLIFLANKGYIEIIDNGSNDFTIRKLKEYDGKNENEKLFLTKMFDGGKNEITSEFFSSNEFCFLNEIVAENMNAPEIKKEVFEKAKIDKGMIVRILIILSYLVITIPAISSIMNINDLLFALIPIIMLIIVLEILFRVQYNYVKVFVSIIGLSYGTFSWMMTVAPVLSNDSNYLKVYLIGIVCIFGMIVCSKSLTKRTQYGSEMLDKIRNFKRSIKLVSKDTLSEIIKQDSTYFYEILPFAYALNMSDEWFKKNETIMIQPPIWYHSSGNFNLTAIRSFMNYLIKSSKNMNVFKSFNSTKLSIKDKNNISNNK